MELFSAAQNNVLGCFLFVVQHRVNKMSILVDFILSRFNYDKHKILKK